MFCINFSFMLHKHTQLYRLAPTQAQTHTNMCLCIYIQIMLIECTHVLHAMLIFYLLHVATSMTVSPMPLNTHQLCEYYDRNYAYNVYNYSKHLIHFSGNNGDWVGNVHYYSDCVWYNYYTTGVDYNETTS